MTALQQFWYSKGAIGPVVTAVLAGSTLTVVATPDTAIAWLWNFGDGTTSTLRAPPPHTYSTPGPHNVVLTTTYETAGGCSQYQAVTLLTQDAVEVVPGDPFWLQSLALLHFDGDTVNKVPGGIAFGITNGTNTPTTDGPPKWGSASLDLHGSAPGGGGTGGAIGSLPTTGNGWGLTDGDFTMECWGLLRTAVTTAYAPLIRTYDDLSRTEIALRCESVGGGVKLYALVATSEAGQTAIGATLADPLIPIGAWFHAALSRGSGIYRLWLNGVQVGTWTSTYTRPGGPKGVHIGAVGGFAIDGLIDDVRVTKACRYTAPFAPPTRAFPDFPE